MSAAHNKETVQHYYEGDQSKLYSGIMQHHTDVNSDESKAQVKRIWNIFWILLGITIAEVAIGMTLSHSLPKSLVIFYFLTLTLVKAAYIVRVFMHLGDELKGFLITVLIPLVIFIWFIIAFLADGGFWLHMNNSSSARHNSATQQVEKQ